VRTLGLLLVGAFVAGLLTQSALARPDYKKVLDAQAKDTKIAPVAEELKCNFCHVKDKEKKVRNTYGQALAKCGLSEEKYKELSADKEKKEKLVGEWVQAIMKKAAAEKTPSGETFGELIKAGKAPGTAPKE